jgi:hypothetical protein
MGWYMGPSQRLEPVSLKRASGTQSQFSEFAFLSQSGGLCVASPTPMRSTCIGEGRLLNYSGAMAYGSMQVVLLFHHDGKLCVHVNPASISDKMTNFEPMWSKSRLWCLEIPGCQHLFCSLYLSTEGRLRVRTANSLVDLSSLPASFYNPVSPESPQRDGWMRYVGSSEPKFI